ncbi:hypothetical protein RSA8_15380 [Enterobacter hormaechei subsp. xiangfangensis]|nr:hypothetical protein RSA8_15380 [Enterobacter hormaechei subsp. xiangfangensis]
MEYSLTPLGREVSEKVAALADWIEVNTPQVMANRDERACLKKYKFKIQDCRPCKAKPSPGK